MFEAASRYGRHPRPSDGAEKPSETSNNGCRERPNDGRVLRYSTQYSTSMWPASGEWILNHDYLTLPDRTKLAKTHAISHLHSVCCLLEPQTSRLPGSFTTNVSPCLIFFDVGKNTSLCLSTCLQELQTSLLTGRVFIASWHSRFYSTCYTPT